MRHEGLRLGSRRDLVTIIVDPDLGEVRGEELALHGVIRGGVEGTRLLQQVEIGQYRLALLLDDIRRRRQPLGQGVPLDLELGEALTHLVGAERSVGDQIQKPLLLDIQGRQLALHAGMGLALGAELLLQAGRHVLPHGRDLVRGQSEGLHLALKRMLDERNRQMR